MHRPELVSSGYVCFELKYAFSALQVLMFCRYLCLCVSDLSAGNFEGQKEV